MRTAAELVDAEQSIHLAGLRHERRAVAIRTTCVQTSIDRATAHKESSQPSAEPADRKRQVAILHTLLIGRDIAKPRRWPQYFLSLYYQLTPPLCASAFAQRGSVSPTHRRRAHPDEALAVRATCTSRLPWAANILLGIGDQSRRHRKPGAANPLRVRRRLPTHRASLPAQSPPPTRPVPS